MKFLFRTFFLICLSALSVSTQIDRTTGCPTISVSGVGSDFNGFGIFRVLFSKEIENYNVKSNWTLKGTATFEGQGKKEIRVPWKTLCDNPVTATLEVSGLPPECPRFASETSTVSDCSFSRPELIDQVFSPKLSINKTILDNLAVRLQEKPSGLIVIIEKLSKKTSRTTAERRIRRNFNYLLVNKQIPKEKLILVVEADYIDSTQYWFTPDWSLIVDSSLYSPINITDLKKKIASLYSPKTK